MVQAITDCAAFLAEARDAVYRLSCDQNTARQLAAEKAQKTRELESAKKSVSDTISQTTRKRLDSINASYDKEIARGQDRLKKARSSREKAKNRGMKERIAEETAQLREHNRELRLQMKTLFQKDRVPLLFRGTFYYALYNPRGIKELLLALATLLICFLGIPCGIYLLIPGRQTLHLMAVYFLDILLFGGVYLKLGSTARKSYALPLKQGRLLRSQIRSNNKKIQVITRSIRRDGSEELYDLKSFDDEIACAQQELEEIAAKKKDALNTFESVTKNIIADEIQAGQAGRLSAMEQELAELSSSLQSLEESINRQSIHITDTYGPYLDEEYLQPDRLAALSRLIQNGSASSLTEAIALDRENTSDQSLA